MSKKHVAVIGAGPVGSILSAYLSNADHEVHLVEIQSHLLDPISEHGLQIVGVHERFARIDGTYSSIEGLRGVEIEEMYICSKANDLHAVSHQVRELARENVDYICFQNGIDNEEILAAHVPRERVFRAVINYAGMIARPGVVRMTFFHPPNYIGSLVPESAETAKRIAQMHNDMGIETRYSERVQKEAWRKSILDSVMMPVSVATRLPMSGIMEKPELRAIVEALLREFLDVARCEGFVYEDDFPENAMQYLAAAGDHKPSMLMDFEAGRPLEIDFLNNRLQQYAADHGVEVPANKLLCAIVDGLLMGRDAVNGKAHHG